VQYELFEDAFGPAQTDCEVDQWVDGRPVPDCPRKLGHDQFATDPSDPSDEEPRLAGLWLLDGELEQCRRI
jgi:hypothetical protein